MIATTRASLSPKLLALLVCLICAALLPAPSVAGAEGTVTYQHESFKEYEKQLAEGQVQAVTINKKVRSVHVTLKGGRHVLAKYAAHEESKVAAALEAKGVTPTVETKAQADKEAKKSIHHKLRYIAAGVLVLVVLVVGAVLAIDRKRKRERD